MSAIVVRSGPPAVKARAEKFDIVETDDGWEVGWPDDRPGYDDRIDVAGCYGSAFDALEGVKAWADKLAKAGTSSVLSITWEPTTRIGRAVVRALTDGGVS